MKTIKELLIETGFNVHPKQLSKWVNGKYEYSPDPEGGYRFESIAHSDVIKILDDKFDDPDIVCHYLKTGRILMFAIKIRGPKLALFYANSMGTNIHNWEVYPDMKRLRNLEHYHGLTKFAKEGTTDFEEEQTDEYNILGTMMRLEK